MVECCKDLLSKIDIFTYMPVPHTYPVSSTKSKIASLLFITILLGYFIYDFVIFVLFNTPVINGYIQSTPENSKYTLPDISFGFFYGEDLDQILNDETYFSYEFVSVEASLANGTLQTSKTSIELTTNCEPEWLSSYSSYYHNLTCVNSSLALMNPPLKRRESISQRLVLKLCPENSSISCKSERELLEMLAGGRLFFFINEPQGFDYRTGQIIYSEYPFEIYSFFLIPDLYNRINIQFQHSVFYTYPNYLTSFMTSESSYMKTISPVSTMSDVSVYNTELIMSITMEMSADMYEYEIHFQTLIDRISMWGALTSSFFTILALCCLAYNRRKFLRKHPSWGEFDQTLKKKFDLEMTGREHNLDEDSPHSAISNIRKHVEIQEKL